MRVFWILYMLFFAIPFPMILYYSINYSSDMVGEGSHPWLALIFLFASVVLWLVVLYKLYQYFVVFTQRAKKNIENLLSQGVLVEAQILEVKMLKPVAEGVESLELTVQFDNFSGTPVRQAVPINDSKPHLRRYEVGKSLKLRVDKSLKSQPVLVPDGIQVELKRGRLAFQMIAWLVIVFIVVAYYLFSYQLENRGTGWRFLVFWHPLLLCPLILLLYQIGIGTFLKKFVGGPKDALRLKFYGKRTQARLLNARQTGTYINEQPQVKFELTYEDERGCTHQVSFRKIVSLLEIGLTQQAFVDIFYLRDDPQSVAFARDLEA